MKGKVLKIIAIVLLTALCVFLIWNIVLHIKTVRNNVEYINYFDKNNKEHTIAIQRIKETIALSILRSICSLFTIFSSGCFVYGIVKSMYTIEVAAKIKYSSQQIDEYISILKSRRQAKKKARDEKRRKKLQEELNKYEES